MVLAIDQRTTGTTCFVFDRSGEPVGRSYSEFQYEAAAVNGRQS